MKKLLFIILLCVSTLCKAQGIKLSGVRYTDPSTGYNIDTLCSYANYSYSSIDSMISLQLPVSASQSNAKAKVIITYPQAYGLPVLNFTFKSAIGFPTATSLLNTVKPLLQNQYGFTVTTF